MTMKPPVPPARSPKATAARPSTPRPNAPRPTAPRSTEQRSTEQRSAEQRRPSSTSSQTSSEPTTAPAGTNSDGSSGRSAAVVVTVKRIFAAETGNYFLLLGTTLFLVAFGLVMVLSSSSIESYLQNDSDFFAAFSKQGLYALIGIPLMLLASRFPASFWKKWAWLFLVIGVCLQLLVFVPGIGFSYGGNTNWIKIGNSFSAQPSELVKLALIVWIAWVLWTKASLLDDWRHVLLPIGPVAGIAIGFVLLGGDLGTGIVMLSIVFGALFFAGIKMRFLIPAAILVAVFGVIFAQGGSSRTSRISAWLNGCVDVDALAACWQPTHGLWALASGGVFGVGLGNSKAKWSWLPEADNDFIFAIIGEELGLIGAIVVLVLFVVLAFSFIRIIRATDDPFARIVTSGVMVWIIVQAIINISVVLGLLPVLGVPLPLISAGGSALIASLIAIGVVLSFARNPVRNEDVLVPNSPSASLSAPRRVRAAR